MDYLDPTDKAAHINHREFWGIGLASEKFHTCKTDQNGKYEFKGLPFQTYAHLRVSHLDFASQRIYAGITDQRMREFERPSRSISMIRNGQQVNEVRFETTPISVNPVRVRLVATSTVTIHVVDEDGNPLKGFGASAVGSSEFGSRTTAYQKVDSQGIADLKLPPGDFALSLRPPRTSDRVTARQQMKVEKGKNKTIRVTPSLGAILVLKAVDSETGQPIKGVSFMIRVDGNKRQGLNSVPHYFDHPSTDNKGMMRVLLPAGTQGISPGYSPLPDGYRATKFEYDIRLEPGKVTTQVVELSK